jgi:hypothetical protein
MLKTPFTRLTGRQPQKHTQDCRVFMLHWQFVVPSLPHATCMTTQQVGVWSVL